MSYVGMHSRDGIVNVHLCVLSMRRVCRISFVFNQQGRHIVLLVRVIL